MGMSGACQGRVRGMSGACQFNSCSYILYTIYTLVFTAEQSGLYCATWTGKTCLSIVCFCVHACSYILLCCTADKGGLYCATWTGKHV